MVRPQGKGLILENVSSWIIDLTDTAGTATVTYDSEVDPGGIVAIRWSLDGLGLLSSAEVDSVYPPTLTPFSTGIRLTLRDGSDEHRIWEGYLKNVSTSATDNGAGALYTLQIGGLHEIIMQKYWHDFATTMPPKIPRLSVNSSYNLLGIDIPDIGAFADPYTTGYDKVNRLVKVSEVIEKAIEPYPEATWGVDGERRILLGRPQDGTPVTLDPADTIGLHQGPYEIPPYITEMRSDGGRNRSGYQYYRISPPVADFVPEKAQDANGAAGKSYRTTSGPFWKAAKVIPNPHYVVKIDADLTGGHQTYYPETMIMDGYGGEDFFDADINGTRVTDGGATVPLTFTTVSKSGLAYVIADVQGWYDSSSLATNASSSYEPIQAAFPMDLQIERIPVKAISEGSFTESSYLITVDAVAWLSTSSTFDTNAVGQPGTPVYETLGSRSGGVDGYGNPLPDTYFNQIKSMEGKPSAGPIYPFESGDTISIISSSRMEVDVRKSNYQQPISLTFAIDSKWFREDHRQELIDAGYSDRFYYHIAFGFAVTTNGDPLQAPYPSYKAPDNPDGTAAGRAKVNFTIREPLFSSEVQGSPEWDADSVGLEYPFYAGPNYEGWFKGILVPPIKLSGTFYKSTAQEKPFGVPRPGSTTINQYIAGVDSELTPSQVRSSFRTNILPYKRQDPHTYYRR